MPDNEHNKKVKWLNRVLFELSENEGLAKKEVADSINIRPSYLSAMISGRRNLSDSMIHKLCTKFNLLPPNEDQLFREEQRQYAAGNPAGVAEVIKEHNASLQANLADLRKNIEDLRRENETISQYIKDLKQQQ